MRKSLNIKETGFSLIELLVVIALLSIVLVFVSINLFSPSEKAKLDSISTNVVSTLREAQNKAINTDTQGESQANEYGVHFESDKFILFQGTSFDSGDEKNFVINLPGSITITPNLPCPSPPGDCNNIVFEKISGEVSNFNSLENTVCINETSTGKDILITINFVGVTNVQEGC